MMNQEVINELARRVRREVIYALLKKSFLDHRVSLPEQEQMAYEIEQIAQLPCKTKLMKRLFEDAEDMRREKGLYAAPPSVSDLKFCCEKRGIGYRSVQNVKFSFLPHREDSELRSLPSVRQMLAIYSDAIKHGEKILLPRNSATNSDTMIAMDVVKQINFGGSR